MTASSSSTARVNVGVAVAGQDALVVPTVFDADSKSLGQIARESRALAERVRTGAVTPPELSSGTFTVSNLGMYGIKRFVAVINPPQAAILAVGALEPRPVVRDREVDRALDHGAHALLRPPHPLRRRRRASSSRRSASTSRTRYGSRSSQRPSQPSAAGGASRNCGTSRAASRRGRACRSRTG